MNNRKKVIWLLQDIDIVVLLTQIINLVFCKLTFVVQSVAVSKESKYHALLLGESQPSLSHQIVC